MWELFLPRYLFVVALVHRWFEVVWDLGLFQKGQEKECFFEVLN